VAWVGVIFIFVFIALVTYIPNRSEDLDMANREARMAIKNRVTAEQEKRATTYEWINEGAGQVRLPLERARELIVSELQSAETGT
jgi:hypothetical protein